MASFKDYGLEEIMRPGEEEVELSLTGAADLRLPSHIRCASHTISLVATTDLKRGLEEKVDSTNRRNKIDFKSTMNSTFGKCSLFGIKLVVQCKLLKLLKQFPSMLGSTGCNRWNSTYDAVDCLLTLKDFIDKICEAAEEYKTALKPVAWLWTNFRVRRTFTLLHLGRLSTRRQNPFCIYNCNHLKNGISKRFGTILSLDTVNAQREVLSALLLPCVKFRWVPEKSLREARG
ncbi:hypothetical protein Ocin01_11247 [Orchesella cincta]|uniref:Uncharacterized protein n=1 Tax=Orchesella cincta TaxID=48709 RepID=A0A1D2MQP5_ORCCI|nr:hypothetical protein Ocin01_11247 [Orchesella cincta]